MPIIIFQYSDSGWQSLNLPCAEVLDDASEMAWPEADGDEDLKRLNPDAGDGRGFGLSWPGLCSHVLLLESLATFSCLVGLLCCGISPAAFSVGTTDASNVVFLPQRSEWGYWISIKEPH